jgi:hypothetical protein
MVPVKGLIQNKLQLQPVLSIIYNGKVSLQCKTYLYLIWVKFIAPRYITTG